MYAPVHRLRLPLLLLARLAASCAPGRTPSPIGLGVPAMPAMPAAAPIVTGPDQLVPLPDGPSAFSAIVAELGHASHSVDLELYELQRPDLASLLLGAHDRGVLVTAIEDPSERRSRPIWAELQQGGIRVVAFPVERLTIDHVKLLIVDGVEAIVGGINWGTHSRQNHDFDVLAVGPVVDNLERVFREDLALARDPPALPAPAGVRPDAGARLSQPAGAGLGDVSAGRSSPVISAEGARPATRSNVGATSRSLPPARSAVTLSAPARMNGTGLIVWAVSGAPPGSSLSSALP